MDSPEAFCRPFNDPTPLTADDVHMYSDASRSWVKGFGAICDKSWQFSRWDTDLVREVQPSIEYLELFAVCSAVLTWLHRFKNRQIYLYCDNESVCKMINRSSNRCKNCMVLIRLITLHSLKYNTRVFARWIKSKLNGPSDTLSRLQLQRFWSLMADDTDSFMTPIPEELWSMAKIWQM